MFESNGEITPPYEQRWVMRSAGVQPLLRQGLTTEALRITRGWLAEVGEPAEQLGVLVPFGQLGADDLVVDGFEGFAFRLGRAAEVGYRRGALRSFSGTPLPNPA
jgi:hypothetical protein